MVRINSTLDHIRINKNCEVLNFHFYTHSFAIFLLTSCIWIAGFADKLLSNVFIFISLLFGLDKLLINGFLIIMDTWCFFGAGIADCSSNGPAKIAEGRS